MKRSGRKFGLLAAALLPLALVLLIAVAAAGQENGPGALETSSSVLVPAADFVDDGLTAQDYAFEEAGGYTYLITDTFNCMQAPVYLPDGVTVSSFGGYVYDNDPSGRIQYIDLRRVTYQPGAASSSDLMGQAWTTNGFVSTEVIFEADESISDAVVDNGKYVYYTAVCMNGGPGPELLRLYAVEAFYSQ